jgi:predicted ferric reductase
MKKTIFVTAITLIIGISLYAIFNVFYSFYTVMNNPEGTREIVTKTTVYFFFLRLTGTLTFICVGIAATIGAFRNWIFSFYKNIEFWKIHTRWASSLAIGFGISHFILFLLYQGKLNIPISLKLFTPDFSKLTTSSSLIFFSTTGLIILTLNVITAHIPGVQSKKWWKPLHAVNFLAFFLVLTHAYYIGSDSSSTPFQLLYGLFLTLVLAGAVYRGITDTRKLRIQNTTPTTPPTVPTPIAPNPLQPKNPTN